MIYITFILQFVIAVLSYRKYKELELYSKKNNKKCIYFHEIKSFLDAYKYMMIGNFSIIVTLILYQLIQQTYQSTLLITNSIFIVIAIIFLQIALGSISWYAFSEIKHISIKDEIGIKCYKKYNSTKDLKKVRKHFLWIHLLGALGGIVSIIQMLMLNYCLGITYTLLIFAINILGLADVLQHRNYNADGYEDELKKMNFLERYYVLNILQLFKDKEYLKSSFERLQMNLSNIFLGIRALSLSDSKLTLL